jgi:DNA-binding NarL/FixJ family response regulator
VNHKVDTVTAGRRVVIAEDSVLLLAGLTKLLESAGFEVAATAADAAGLLAAVEREQPDVVIADVRMPPTHTDEGIRAALVIRSQWPDVAVLVLSQYVEEQYAADLLSANTRGIGYLLKDRVADVAEFLDALRRVAAGGTALDPEVVAQLLVRRGGDPLDVLTERERGVLALMAEGRSNAEIATALVITDSAVSKHINSIFAKLGLYPRDAGHRRVLAVLRYLGVDPALLDLDEGLGPRPEPRPRGRSSPEGLAAFAPLVARPVLPGPDRAWRSLSTRSAECRLCREEETASPQARMQDPYTRRRNACRPIRFSIPASSAKRKARWGPSPPLCWLAPAPRSASGWCSPSPRPAAGPLTAVGLPPRSPGPGRSTARWSRPGSPS